MEELAADGVAHVVFLRRRAPVGLKQIRDLLFSDLSWNEDGLLPENHKFKRIVVINGLLRAVQN